MLLRNCMFSSGTCYSRKRDNMSTLMQEQAANNPKNKYTPGQSARLSAIKQIIMPEAQKTEKNYVNKQQFGRF